MLASQHEQQLGVFIQQMEEQRRRQEEAGIGEQGERPTTENKFRLDVLKQKDKTSESAVASPEVVGSKYKIGELTCIFLFFM